MQHRNFYFVQFYFGCSGLTSDLEFRDYFLACWRSNPSRLPYPWHYLFGPVFVCFIERNLLSISCERKERNTYSRKNTGFSRVKKKKKNYKGKKNTCSKEKMTLLWLAYFVSGNVCLLNCFLYFIYLRSSWYYVLFDKNVWFNILTLFQSFSLEKNSLENLNSCLCGWPMP